MVAIRALLMRLFAQIHSRLWVRPAVYCVSAIGIIALAVIADRMVTEIDVPYVSANVIESLLGIMASSMLVVVTFSVSVLAAAYASAIGTTTPRAFNILVADSPTKQALSSFIGAFIFSVIGFIAIGAGSVGPAGRLVIMAMTVGIFLWVVGTLVYWIDHVARLGQVRSTLEKVARHAGNELAEPLKRMAHLGGEGQARTAAGPVCPVYSMKAGAVQAVSVDSLADCAEAIGAPIRVLAPAGTMVGPSDPLCEVGVEGLVEAQIENIRQCFVIGRLREPQDNAVLSLRAMSEIASRALSPGINDPGTAIDVVDALVGVFDRAVHKANRTSPKNRTPQVMLPAPDAGDLLAAAFEAIGRDGAGQVEVATAVQNGLRLIGEIAPDAFQAAVDLQSERALGYARPRLEFDWERKRVEAAARKVGERHRKPPEAIAAGT